MSEVYKGPMSKVEILIETPTHDQEGAENGVLKIGDVIEVPSAVADQFVIDGIAKPIVDGPEATVQETSGEYEVPTPEEAPVIEEVSTEFDLELPEDASDEQKRLYGVYAKFAAEHPTKWAQEKSTLVAAFNNAK